MLIDNRGKRKVPNENMYALIETIADNTSGTETNLISITSSKEVAIHHLDIMKKKYKERIMDKLCMDEDDYIESIHTDLDSVFDFCTESGEYEYHLLVCTPLGVNEQ